MNFSDNSEELLPVVDEACNVVGCATRGECHDGVAKPLHPVVHLHVYDANGRLCLQKRPEWKDIQPGKWDTAVGGHVDLGESIEQALRREAAEELGLADFTPELLDRYIFESDRERELISSYCTQASEADLSPTAELDGIRFWTLAEIESAIGNGIFTPNFEQEFQRLPQLRAKLSKV